MQKLFTEAGWSELPAPNELRIDKIEQRAMGELIAKESISFVFHSFGSVLSSFADTFLSDRSPTDPQDYKVF